MKQNHFAMILGVVLLPACSASGDPYSISGEEDAPTVALSLMSAETSEYGCSTVWKVNNLSDEFVEAVKFDINAFDSNSQLIGNVPNSFRNLRGGGALIERSMILSNVNCSEIGEIQISSSQPLELDAESPIPLKAVM